MDWTIPTHPMKKALDRAKQNFRIPLNQSFCQCTSPNHFSVQEPYHAEVFHSKKCLKWESVPCMSSVRLTLSLLSLSSGGRFASLEALLRKASLGLFSLGEGTGSRPSRTRNILFQFEQPTAKDAGRKKHARLAHYVHTVEPLYRGHQLAVLYTVEPLYRGHQLAVLYREVSLLQRQICTQLCAQDSRQCPHQRGVPFSECPLQRGSTVFSLRSTMEHLYKPIWLSCIGRCPYFRVDLYTVLCG